MRPLRPLPLACLLLGTLQLTGCPHPAAPAQQVSPPAVRQQVRLELVQRTWSELPAVQEALSPVAELTFVLRLELELAQVERFGDGSEALSVRFLRALGGATEAELLPVGLEGRELRIRRFADGEILAVGGGPFLVGAGRDLETFDLLLPALSPWPPDVKEGATVLRAARWPIEVVEGLGMKGRLDGSWSYVGREVHEGASVHHLHYQGPWSTSGWDRRAAPRQLAKGSGSMEGDLLLDSADHSLVRHEIQAGRVMELSWQAAPDAPVVKLWQDQRFHLLLEPLP